MEYRNMMMTLYLVIGVVGSSIDARVIEDTNTQISKDRSRRHAALDNSKLCKAFGCVNGYCKDSELRNFRIVCECFPGYEGKLCDRHKCPFACGQHGTCTRKGHLLYCKCDEGYFGASCDSYVQTLDLTQTAPRVATSSFMQALGGLLGRSQPQPGTLSLASPSSWYATKPKPTNRVKLTEFHSHAEIDTSVKPDVCAPGFQCYHGNCDRDAMALGMFACVCKPNFTGLFCEKRCTLNCQNGGSCMVLPDGHQLCACPFDFTGHYCQKPI